MSLCIVCSTTNKNMQICSACKNVHYCSVECQKSNWKSHKTECFKLGQVKLSDQACQIILNNIAFNKIFQYIHHFNISEENIDVKIMLCLISPNFDTSNKIESYSCILNIGPLSGFSEDIKLRLIENKRSVFLMYYDKLHNDMNSSKGSIINFDFDFNKRDMLCYESVKTMELPAEFTVYDDGRFY